MPIVLLFFILSLALTLAASSWFTQRLEAICDALSLPPSLLSFLGALGANIPNYAASIFAIANGQPGVGLGIIIGSNIYNVTIILAITTFASRKRAGITLTIKESQDARIIAHYTLAIMCSILLTIWLLPGTFLFPGNPPELSMQEPSLLLAALLSIGLFILLTIHALKRVPHSDTTHNSVPTLSDKQQQQSGNVPMATLLRWMGGGVLAVATSLPNTVVAFILARTAREAACVEEIFSSNSINAVLGLAFPLLFWHDALHDKLLLVLDTPLMVVVTLLALLCVLTRRISRLAGSAFLLAYVLWVMVHVLL